MQNLIEGDLTGTDGGKKWYNMLRDRNKVPIKLLRFHEDVRPGYIGTSDLFLASGL
jgi:chromatin assembly factor 1 subunit A